MLLDEEEEAMGDRSAQGEKEGIFNIEKKKTLHGRRMLCKDSATVNEYSHSVKSSNNMKICTQLMQKHSTYK